MLKNPCVKNCPERSATCRLTCERGRAYFAERRKIYEERQKIKLARGEIDDYQKREVDKSRKAQPSWRRK